MDKRYAHHLWTRVRPIRPWYFLLIAGMSAGLGVVGLRENNLQMVQLRNAVYVADKNDGDVQAALQQLQLYVTNHMNTDLSVGPNAPYPPIQLVYTYDRAVQAASAKVGAANAKIYIDAQAYCEGILKKGQLLNRVQCVQQYVHDHGVTDIPVVPDGLYKFDFATPVWSPDIAGWSLVIAAMSSVIFAGWSLVRWLLRLAGK